MLYSLIGKSSLIIKWRAQSTKDSRNNLINKMRSLEDFEEGSLTDFEKPETGYPQSTTSPRM